MTWKVEFELTTPDEVGAAEATLAVADVLQDMAAHEAESGMNWAVRNVRLVREAGA